MKAIIRLVTLGAATGALGCAAPAAAQYAGYGYGVPYPGYSTERPNGYGGYTQIAVNQCAEAVQARLDAPRNAYGDPYGYSGARVLEVSQVDARGYGGGVTVAGAATSGQYAGFPGARTPVDLSWQCTTNSRGMIVGVSINRLQSAYGYEYHPPALYNDDVSRYGYVRY